MLSETGELYSFGQWSCGVLGLGNDVGQHTPHLVAALQAEGVHVSGVVTGSLHSLGQR